MNTKHKLITKQPHTLPNTHNDLSLSSTKTEAMVVEEGKDVIVQLTPQGPEKDYGQSSPEDSDMYTTRG